MPVTIQSDLCLGCQCVHFDGRFRAVDHHRIEQVMNILAGFVVGERTLGPLDIHESVKVTALNRGADSPVDDRGRPY